VSPHAQPARRWQQSTAKWVGAMINLSLATVADLGLQGPPVQVAATNQETV